MMRRNPYSTISLDAPSQAPTTFGDASVPQMPALNFAPIQHAQMEDADTGGQVSALGDTFQKLRARFGGSQGDKIKGALANPMAMGKM